MLPFEPNFVRCGSRELVLTRLDESYVPEVAAVERLCFPSPWTEQMIAQEFRVEFAFVMGLIADGRVIGYSCNHLIGGELHILSFAVHPQEQHKGCGKLMLESCLDYAAANGAKCAHLEVRASNVKAQNLYRKFGFQIAYVRRDYYSDRNEDALVMMRFLPEPDASAGVAAPRAGDSPQTESRT